MSSLKFSKEAMKDWDFIKTLDDLMMWHTVYTPWIPKEALPGLIKEYEARFKSGDPKYKKAEETVFEKLYKQSF